MSNENLDIIHTAYYKPKYSRTGGKFDIERRDCLVYTVRNNDTGNTDLIIKPCPDYTFYRTKTNNYRYPQISISENEVDELSVPYNTRNYEFAKSINKTKEYSEMKHRNYFEKNEWLRKNIIASPFLYSVDFNIEDQLKLKFYKGRNIGAPKFRKAFADIEVDINGLTSEIDTSGDNAIAPVNCITYFDETYAKVYAFLLDNQPNNLRLQYIKNNTEKYIKEKLESKLVNIQEYYPDKIVKDWIEINFYQNEERLLIDFFSLIHRNKPDFVGFWYMPFDIKYMFNRIRKLNLNPEKVCCHPDVPDEFKRIDYIYDPHRNPNNPNKDKKDDTEESEWVDWVNVAGYTQFYDMRCMYSNIRKRFKEPEYSLDYITNKELGEGKVSLSHYELTIRTAAYKNYDIFLEYALTDTLRLFQLERKTKDLNAWYVYSGCTRLSKCHNVSIVIKNTLTHDVFQPEKSVAGNNVLYDIWGHISGAIVAIPRLCDASCVMINGKKTNLFRNAVDSDASSQYPSLSESLNIAKSTVFYKGLEIFRESDNFNEPIQILGDGNDFHQMLQTRTTSLFDLGTKYFNLPEIDKMNDELRRYINDE